MIPVSLTLRNFLSYGDDVPPLLLEGVHVACLCGPNGHGKSSLLDAMTWALWGVARAKNQEELIHQGQREMMVALEFKARDQRYRVERRHSRVGRSRQGQTGLELQVSRGDTFVPISGSTVRETEVKIQGILSMDYPTFINSAFLRQGDSDLFTKAGPAQRKKVLAEILSLSQYDLLEELAKGHAAEREALIQRTSGEVDQLRVEVARRPEYQEDLSRVDGELRSIQGKLDAQEALVRQRWDALQALTGSQTRLTEVMNSYTQISEERNRLQSVLQQEQQRLNWEALSLEQRVGELTLKVAQSLEAKVEAQRLVPEIQAHQDQEQAFRRDRDALSRIGAEAQEARRDLERLKVEGTELGNKLNMLHLGDHQDTHCPLCNTQLGEESRGHLETTYEAEIEDKRNRYGETNQLLKELELKEKSLAESAGRNEVELTRRLTQLTAQQIDLTRQATERPRLQEELSGVQAELLARRRMVDQAQFGQAERQQLATIEEQLATTGKERSTLEEALRPLPQVKASYEQELAQMESLRRQREPLAAQELSLKELLARSDRMEKDLEERQMAVAGLADEKGLFGELATAFGKGGIQALIIESAVPELEAEANALLARLTDGRMALKLETQRERRMGKGDPIETLEINIGDELGTRSYELFSGGEAFRINFALRVSLSRLLARRSGAPLPTLFIDEGFGTQDAAGRERLIDAIRAIQDDFQCIIVITHIDELKEAFPTRIEVSKTDGKSTFWIN
jgi:exonuclease SbcC